MRTFIFTSVLIAAFCGSVASASTIDFGTSAFASTFGPNTTTEVVNGVNFSFTATAHGSNGFRQNNTALMFGKPGNSMLSLSIVADADLEYTSIFGLGHTFTSQANQLPFDLFVNNALLIDNLTFIPTTYTSISLNNLFVSAGDTLLIDVDYTGFSSKNRTIASATLQSLNFNLAATTATVPTPPALLLIITAIFGLLGIKKYRQSKFA